MSVAVDLELTPGLDRVRELAREHNLVPLRHTFIADCETPVSAYLKLREEGPSFLLESAEQGQRVGRWSFLGFRPRATIRMALGDHPDPYAVVAEDEVEQSYEQAAAAIAEVKERLAGPVPRHRPGRRDQPQFFSNLGRDGYGAAVERAIEYIHAGDAYQVVPSQRWTANCPVDAFSIYRGLRAINPSPYMYFLDFEDFPIAGASPETLVTVTGRTVLQRPIAGTRPRSGSDDLVAGELLADDKERAEHVMLVDLGRNDL